MSQSPEYVTVEEMKTRLRSNNHVVPSKSVRAELARLCLQHNLMTEMESLVTRNPRDTRRAWLVAAMARVGCSLADESDVEEAYIMFGTGSIESIVKDAAEKKFHDDHTDYVNIFRTFYREIRDDYDNDFDNPNRPAFSEYFNEPELLDEAKETALHRWVDEQGGLVAALTRTYLPPSMRKMMIIEDGWKKFYVWVRATFPDIHTIKARKIVGDWFETTTEPFDSETFSSVFLERMRQAERESIVEDFIWHHTTFWPILSRSADAAGRRRPEIREEAEICALATWISDQGGMPGALAFEGLPQELKARIQLANNRFVNWATKHFSALTPNEAAAKCVGWVKIGLSKTFADGQYDDKFRATLDIENIRAFYNKRTSYKAIHDELKDMAMKKYKGWIVRPENARADVNDFFNTVVTEKQAQHRALEEWIVCQGGLDAALSCGYLPPSVKKQLLLGKSRFISWTNTYHRGVDEKTCMRACKGWLEIATNHEFTYLAFDKFESVMVSAQGGPSSSQPGSSSAQARPDDSAQRTNVGDFKIMDNDTTLAIYTKVLALTKKQTTATRINALLDLIPVTPPHLMVPYLPSAPFEPRLPYVGSWTTAGDFKRDADRTLADFKKDANTRVKDFNKDVDHRRCEFAVELSKRTEKLRLRTSQAACANAGGAKTELTHIEILDLMAKHPDNIDYLIELYNSLPPLIGSSKEAFMKEADTTAKEFTKEAEKCLKKYTQAVDRLANKFAQDVSRRVEELARRN